MSYASFEYFGLLVHANVVFGLRNLEITMSMYSLTKVKPNKKYEYC